MGNRIANHLDEVAKAMAGAHSRRQVLKLIISGIAGSVLALMGMPAAWAGCKKSCESGSTCVDGRCCPNSQVCGKNECCAPGEECIKEKQKCYPRYTYDNPDR
jgi:hypothetical protein